MVDVLADRSAATTACWFRKHPSVEVVSQAMPVILTTPEGVDIWMKARQGGISAPAAVAGRNSPDCRASAIAPAAAARL